MWMWMSNSASNFFSVHDSTNLEANAAKDYSKNMISLAYNKLSFRK